MKIHPQSLKTWDLKSFWREIKKKKNSLCVPSACPLVWEGRLLDSVDLWFRCDRGGRRRSLEGLGCCVCESECVFPHYGISGTPDTSLKCSLCAIKEWRGGCAFLFLCVCVCVCARGCAQDVPLQCTLCPHCGERGSETLMLIDPREDARTQVCCRGPWIWHGCWGIVGNRRAYRARAGSAPSRGASDPLPF